MSNSYHSGATVAKCQYIYIFQSFVKEYLNLAILMKTIGKRQYIDTFQTFAMECQIVSLKQRLQNVNILTFSMECLILTVLKQRLENVDILTFSSWLPWNV